MTENKNLLWALIIIGIIIIIMLASPRLGMRRYSYYPGLTASVVPTYYQANIVTGAPGTYSVVRTYPKTTSYSYTTIPAYSYYYQYQQESNQYAGETVFSDGCTLTSPYSTTTGEPCS